MTLDALIHWIDDAMGRLPAGREVRSRVKHIRRLYKTLDLAGVRWRLRNDWHALGVKIASLLHEPSPAKPSLPSSGVRKRRRWNPPEAPGRARRLAKKPARGPVEINPQLQAAFDAVAAGRPIIFVTGGAGTGKSTFIHELRARFPEKQSVVLAPTGVAALNAGGQTIHSFCRLPLRAVLPEDVRIAKDPQVVKALHLIVIDEISMVRADVLDGIDAFLRHNRKSDAPFGGVQMVLVGDLFQLPPVVTPRDQEVIAAR